MSEIIFYSDTAVQAGFPSPAMDYIEQRIDLTKELVKNPLSTFIVQCAGDSMINAFMPPGAKLVVDRSLTAGNGDIVIAVYNGDFTVKWLRKNQYRSWLVPGNRKYKEIEITGETELDIWGVVTNIITSPNDVRRCMP